MKMAESRIRLPSLTQLSIQSLLFLDYSVAIFLSLVLCAGLHHPSSSCLLIHHLITGAGVYLTEKTSCPGPRRRRAQLSVRRVPSKRVRVPGPLGLMAMNYGCHIPIGLCAREPQRVSLPLHPQAAFPFSMHFCIHFAWGLFLC